MIVKFTFDMLVIAKIHYQLTKESIHFFVSKWFTHFSCAAYYCFIKKFENDKFILKIDGYLIIISDLEVIRFRKMLMCL